MFRSFLYVLTGQSENIPDVPVALRADENGALKVADAGPIGVDNFNNASGTLLAGGTSQQVATAEPTRRFLLIQNPAGETEPLYYDLGRAATVNANSPELSPGQAALFDVVCPTSTVTVNAATAGHRFFVRQGFITL